MAWLGIKIYRDPHTSAAGVTFTQSDRGTVLVRAAERKLISSRYGRMNNSINYALRILIFRVGICSFSIEGKLYCSPLLNTFFSLLLRRRHDNYEERCTVMLAYKPLYIMSVYT